MYRFSRSIYRELVPRILEEQREDPICHKEILDACEATIRRIAFDRRYFARPARSLYRDVRTHFPLSEQLYVYKVIDRNLTLAADFIARMPAEVGLDGLPRHCGASTRKGKPCQREPLPGREYCPSHKHLEETFEELERQFDPIAA
jgi:hypothetical protein